MWLGKFRDWAEWRQILGSELGCEGKLFGCQGPVWVRSSKRLALRDKYEK